MFMNALDFYNANKDFNATLPEAPSYLTTNYDIASWLLIFHTSYGQVKQSLQTMLVIEAMNILGGIVLAYMVLMLIKQVHGLTTEIGQRKMMFLISGLA